MTGPIDRSADDAVLARLGKKQVLKRRFDFWSLFGFAVCELITWETVLALFSQGFENGGPSGLLYGFIIAWSSTLSVYTVISELASMAPIAAGQYYWVYMLSSEKYRVFASYIIGWLTSLAWIATVATETLFAGTMLEGLVILDYSTYTATNWKGTLLTWAVALVSTFINAVIPSMLPRIEIGTVVFHVAGFIVIIALLWRYTGSYHNADFVFRTSLNEGNWPTQGLSYCVGFLGNVATFVGADASVHLAEEVSHAATTIPRVITSSMILNGIVGFVMMITLLFCLGDVDSVLESQTGFPFIQIFYNSVRSVAGATVMGAIVLILTWACATGIITSASRMTWAFARDRGTPFSRIISKVDPRTQVPIIAIGVVVVIACLLTLINIGSSTAFNDVISLTITGFYGSYLVPSALLLYHRLKPGNILPYGSLVDGQDLGTSYPVSAPAASPSDNDTQPDETYTEKTTKPTESKPGNNAPITVTSADEQGRITFAPTQLVWGPWHIPGLLGIINNAYACVYMVFVIFWSVWPPATPVAADTMNYSVVVTGGVIILSIVWYWIRGRKEYKGPLVDKEVIELIQRNQIVGV
ncbi:choline transport protein, putative [Talaromyces stipitatus ATCC 10500]|uniref:Choline transport protein, putative n=1 Tax=Talaromyces stipitatus (strain ATCC 10500 / CBS 375.48 / QM 6759 / NRRL 1006) TaxID=441959 RepID=B8MRY3_TALSN|nr:choline transport protein, putative [Talaromyces stipitatus ATCC 10500]EED13419.1 choline transport protein, putative [Talaromyces stipitatus ATCC 10500]